MFIVWSHAFCVFNAHQKTSDQKYFVSIIYWIIIASNRRPETKQGIEGKIDRFRSGRVRVRVRIRDRVRVRFRSPI